MKRKPRKNKTGRWKRYPKYKDSGIEWLGEVPEHWILNRLKFIASVNDESLGESTDPGYVIQYVDISNVDEIDGIKNKMELKFEDAPSRARRTVRHGDVIISTVRTYLRAIAPIFEPESNLIVSTGFAVIRPKSEFESKFASYALRSPHFVEEVVANSVGVSYPAINASELISFFIVVPPNPEQLAIATFLDSKTTQIDTLIAKKERQIELLREKRAAIISHAVTKGLDPNAKMRDSGIEWLGEVPEHWEIKRMGWISRVVRGASPRPAGDPRFFFGDCIPWLTVADITKDTHKYLNSTETMLTQEGKLQSRVMLDGTLVLTNSGATLGVPKILQIDCCANDGVVAFFDLSPSVIIDFLYYYLFSLTTIYREIKQGSGQPNLNTDIVKGTFLPLPSAIEQKGIVDYIEKLCDEIDSLISKVDDSILFLREYRIALISAAVTGKIDVREEAA